MAILTYGTRARIRDVRANVERTARRLLWGNRPSWQRVPNELPWLDRPDAAARLRARPADAATARILEAWVRDGWVVVDGYVDPADIDAAIATLDGLWDAPAPIPDLSVLGLHESPDEPLRNLTHAEILALPPEHRHRLRDVSNWRIHGFHYLNAAARRIFWNPRLRELSSTILGKRARPIASINFMRGSEQSLHQDMAVFHIHPHNYLLGAWIACEDITADSGPLVFHSGSHREPLFPEFENYPQTNLRTADPARADRYQRWVNERASRYPRHEFIARKGQVLLWHGMLIHGGAPLLRPSATRKSMVLHYTAGHADRTREVEGPFNW